MEKQTYRLRFRHLYMGIGGILTVLLYFLTDPSVGFITQLPMGAGVVAEFVILLKVVLYVAVLHLSRRALFDYIDLSTYFRKAKESPEGASGALNAIAISMIAIAILVAAAVLA